MKPLACITVYGRFRETVKTLESFSPFFNRLDMVIVDNGGLPEARTWLRNYAADNSILYLKMDENVGCPRALNFALELRTPGQPFIKIDNDVVLEGGDSWLEDIETFCNYCEKPIAMIGAYYEPFERARIIGHYMIGKTNVFKVNPVIGHCVYHTSSFMDKVGFFDVLSPEHLYGFEDLTMSHKAAILGYDSYSFDGFKIVNIQRQSALGSRKEVSSHTEKMRPLYNERVLAIREGKYFTNSKGELCQRNTSL